MKSLFILSTLLLLTSCATKNGSSTLVPSKNPDGSSGSVGNSNTTAVDIPVENYKDDSLLVAIELGACFGRCPVEKFYIYASGEFRYEGINFVDHMGDFKGNISKKEVKEIYTMMTNLKISEYPEKFGFGVSDISSKVIVFNFEGKRKKIIFKLYDDYVELKGFISRVRGIMSGVKYRGIKEK